LQRWNEARDAFKQALTLDPDYSDARRALISLELQQNRPGEALRLAEEETRRQPRSAVGPLLEGDVLMAQKQFAQAAKAYERGFALHPSVDLLSRWHKALVLAGDEGKADSVLQGWLKEHPNDVATRMYFAESLSQRKQTKTAIEQYELALKYAPNSALVLNNLALAYSEVKDSRSVATAERAYKAQPQSATVKDTLGWILLVQGDKARAISLLKEAAASSPNAPEIRYHYAVALAQAGDKAKARQELDAALKHQGDFPGKAAAEQLRREL
jgi:putative PEP-CTERM system TPR-repeat lipoprotein